MCKQYSSVCHKGTLVYMCQFKRCLLSCANCSSPQEILSIQYQEPALPIQGPTIRTVSGPSCLHEVHDCSSTFAAVQSDVNPALFRWLAAVCIHKTTSCLQNQTAFGACADSLAVNEAKSNNYLYWNDTGLSCNVCQPLKCQSGQYAAAPGSFPAGSKLAVQDIVTTFRDCSILVAPPQASPTVCSWTLSDIFIIWLLSHAVVSRHWHSGIVRRFWCSGVLSFLCSSRGHSFFFLLLSLLVGRPWQLSLQIQPRSSLSAALGLASESDCLLSDCKPAIIHTMTSCIHMSALCSMLEKFLIMVWEASARFYTLWYSKSYSFFCSIFWIQAKQPPCWRYMLPSFLVNGSSLGSHTLLCSFWNMQDGWDQLITLIYLDCICQLFLFLYVCHNLCLCRQLTWNGYL